jgi:ubiquinone biosynthesis protein COQ4
MSQLPLQFEPRRALKAARILAADPDDLPQVFTIIESLSFDTLNRITRKMESSPVGCRLVATRPDIVDRLADRAALSRLPDGSLGRAYLDFVERENITAEGIREASERGYNSHDQYGAPYDWVSARMRDTHDLWHAVTGYHGDVLGESALLAFYLGQTFNPGIALIVAIGLAKSSRAADGDVARKLILDGYRRGKKAAWLVGLEWETLLDKQVSAVREQLSLEAPPVYRPIRSDEIKAYERQRAAA